MSPSKHNAPQKHSPNIRWKYKVYPFIWSILQWINASFFPCIAHIPSSGIDLLFNGHHKFSPWHYAPCGGMELHMFISISVSTPTTQRGCSWGALARGSGHTDPTYWLQSPGKTCSASSLIVLLFCDSLLGLFWSFFSLKEFLLLASNGTLLTMTVVQSFSFIKKTAWETHFGLKELHSL